MEFIGDSETANSLILCLLKSLSPSPALFPKPWVWKDFRDVSISSGLHTSAV